MCALEEISAIMKRVWKLADVARSRRCIVVQFSIDRARKILRLSRLSENYVNKTGTTKPRKIMIIIGKAKLTMRK